MSLEFSNYHHDPDFCCLSDDTTRPTGAFVVEGVGVGAHADGGAIGVSREYEDDTAAFLGTRTVDDALTSLLLVNNGDAAADDAPPVREFGVVKIMRVPGAGPEFFYKVWWDDDDGSSTVEPRSHLDSIDGAFVAKADAKTGTVVLLTGKRNRPPPRLGNGFFNPQIPCARVAFQDPGGFCVQNSIRNLFDDVPAADVARLVALGPFVSMKELVSAMCHANDFSLDFVKVPVPHSQTLEFLAGKEEGKFLLVSERGTHALAVDAGRGLILESDPAFPNAVPLSLDGFAALGVKAVQSCRRLAKKRQRKRKRKRASR
jgi:hypothetical protein